jgi:hypothetical protein
MSDEIKKFVRNTLGCNCPEEVFQKIDCKSDVKIDENTKLDYEINIGNRLLIFATSIDKVDSPEVVISKLVQAGMKKRDNNKFNRFRLVLLTARINDTAELAQEIFNSLFTDDKTHLHVINKDDFPLTQ